MCVRMCLCGPKVVGCQQIWFSKTEKLNYLQSLYIKHKIYWLFCVIIASKVLIISLYWKIALIFLEFISKKNIQRIFLKKSNSPQYTLSGSAYNLMKLSMTYGWRPFTVILNCLLSKANVILAIPLTEHGT